MLSRLLPVALAALAGCALPNSPGHHRGRPPEADGPLARYRAALAAGDRPGARAERDGLRELEDFVEAAAERLLAEPVDAPTPLVPDALLVVLARERLPGAELRSWGYLVDAHPHAHPLGLKYVVDHAGPDWRRALAHEASDLVAAVVADWVEGRVPLEASRDALRAAEAPLWRDLRLDEPERDRRAARFDAAVGHAAGLAYERRALLGSGPVLVIARREVAGDLCALVATYAHELMHAKLASGPLGAEDLRVEEAFCQAFGDLVAADVLARGELDALRAAEARPAPAARPDAAESTRRLVAALGRLGRLYRTPGLEFTALPSSHGLYGHTLEPDGGASLVAVFAGLLARDGASATLERVRAGPTVAEVRAAL